MPRRSLCALGLLLVAAGCSHSAATSDPSSGAGHPVSGGSSNPATSPGTVYNLIGPSPTPPQAVRHVHLGMTEAAVKNTIGSGQQATLARGFKVCWIYDKSKTGNSVAVVCFRHGAVAFKTAPGTWTKVLRALHRAGRDR